MRALLRKAAAGWGRHHTQDRAAALTYYTLLSFPPIVFLLLGLAKYVAMREMDPALLVRSIASAFPPESAEFIRQFAQGSIDATNLWTTLLSVLFLLWSASALVDGLERAINTIFEAKIRQKDVTLRRIFRHKLIGMWFLLLFCTILILSFLIPPYFSLFFSGALVQALETLLSFLVLSLIAATMLRLLAYVHIPLRELWVSGAIIAAFIVLGKLLLTWIFSTFHIGSDFTLGASIILFLMWVYYTASVILLGIEIVHARLVHREALRYKDYAIASR